MSNSHSKGLNLRLRSLASGGHRRSSRGIVNDTLTKLIRKEVLSGLSAIFEGMRKRGGDGCMSGQNGGFAPDFGRTKCGTTQPAMPQYPGGYFDQKQMEITIDQMVASSLMHGRQTSGVLRLLFGLVPSLIGR